MHVVVAHPEGVELLGDVAPEVELHVWDGEVAAPAQLSDVEFWVPPFLSTPELLLAIRDMANLSVVQLLSAGADEWFGKVPAGATLCDARGVHSSATAEWAATAVLAAQRQFPRFALAQAAGHWEHEVTDQLAGKRVLVVGAGDIGEGVCRRLAPFGVELTRVARTQRDGVHAVSELPDLLPHADIVVVTVPLTPATSGMVDSAFLARMPAGALLVNAARGAVVDTDALVAELAAGRLRAALDVTEPEPLPPAHPLWTVPGLLLTPHVAGSVHGLLTRAYELVGQQLWRYAEGEPLDNVVVNGY